MITKVTGEQPFQVLTNNFSISPSNEGYTLQISADGVNYSNLFTVGAGTTRLVTGVAANSYYRLSGNQSQVSVNWMKTCVTEGGSVDLSAYWTSAETKDYIDEVITSGVDLSNYYTSAQTDELVAQAYSSAVTASNAHADSKSAEIYASATSYTDAAIAGIDLSGYYTSAQTEEAISTAYASANTYTDEKVAEAVGQASGYTDEKIAQVYTSANSYADLAIAAAVAPISAVSAYTRSVEEHLEDVERVTASGYNELHTAVVALSGMSADFVTSAQTKDQIEGYHYITSADTQNFMDSTDSEVIATALNDLNTKKVASDDVHNIVKMTQAAYDALVAQSATTSTTLYIISNS